MTTSKLWKNSLNEDLPPDDKDVGKNWWNNQKFMWEMKHFILWRTKTMSIFVLGFRAFMIYLQIIISNSKNCLLNFASVNLANNPLQNGILRIWKAKEILKYICELYLGEDFNWNSEMGLKTHSTSNCWAIVHGLENCDCAVNERGFND